ncbi:MAG: nucleotidyltransferase domain-containing protein [Methanobacteriaceae archaeon]|nr:nucleotidyltransferase domain-containing protein [Methanobacteriaceae archaeon]
MNVEVISFELARKLSKISSLEAVVLFGSAARGEMHKKSDIDILLYFDADHDPEIGEEGRLVHKLAGEVEKKYHMDNPFSFVFMNKNENIDSEFLWEVAKDGVVLYALPSRILGKEDYLKPSAFISYSFKGLPARDKMFVKRRLYGYQVKSIHGGKEYFNEGKGIVQEQGKKMGRATFLIDASHVDEVLELFHEKNVQYKIIKVWV